MGGEDGQFVLDIVCKPKGQIGFCVLPWCWIVERTFAWLGNYRCPARDYEISPRISEALIKIAMFIPHGAKARLSILRQVLREFGADHLA